MWIMKKLYSQKGKHVYTQFEKDFKMSGLLQTLLSRFKNQNLSLFYLKEHYEYCGTKLNEAQKLNNIVPLFSRLMNDLMGKNVTQIL